MLDLFSPVVPREKWHPNFAAIADSETPYAREVICDWASAFVDRDRKFIKEFQTTFNSSFWELYIFACFKALGLSVDFGFDRPDFVVSNSTHPFSLEATSALHPEAGKPEWKAVEELENLDSLERSTVVDLATIRLSNSLSSKYKKYRNEYKALPHVSGKPFVLGIAPFEQPYFYIQNAQAMTRLLYGYDRPKFRDFPEQNRREIFGHLYMDTIQKPNGSSLDLGLFKKGLMPEISAVVFSNTATFGKVRALSRDPGMVFFEHLRFNENGLDPIHSLTKKSEYSESLLDGLHVFHNATARYPLGMETFDHPDVTQHWYDPTEDMPFNDMKDGGLLQRSVIRLVDKP